MPDRLKPHAAALAAGLTGAALAALVGVPAGPLVGATLAVALAALAGWPVAMSVRLRDLAFAAIGVSLGSGVDERILSQLAQWATSLVVLLVALVATMAASCVLLIRVFRIDPGTAVLSSAPGTMSNAIAIALEGKGDATAVMGLQLIRLLVLVLAVPPIAAGLGGTEDAVTAGQAMDWAPLLAVGAVALLLGAAGTRLGLPAAFLLAGMFVSATGHALGLVHGAAPDWLIFAAFAVTGAVLGTRMSRVDAAMARRFAAAGLSLVAVAVLVSLGFAWLAAALTGLPFGQVWVAFAPGGVEAMAAIGLALGYDPAFVAVHHVARIFALVLIVPAFLAWLGGPDPRA